jgi:hypothetical protein
MVAAQLAGDNPLKSDPQLVALLKKLDTIVKYKYFHRWKKSFLDRLLPQIQSSEKRGMQVADEASERFDAILAKTAKQAHKVVDIGKKSSNKATLALRELLSLMQQTTAALTEWILASSSEEKKQGYTKFHLGAALIQQGFPHYITMQGMQQALKQIQDDILANSADRQQIDVFRSYHTQVDRFCVSCISFSPSLPAFSSPIILILVFSFIYLVRSTSWPTWGCTKL